MIMPEQSQGRVPQGTGRSSFSRHRASYRHRLPLLLVHLVAVLVPAGCSIQIPGSQSLFPVGTPFVLGGTATLVDSPVGSCPVWIGDNGVTYYLYQDTKLDNDLFDQITTPGVTSRLELVVRTDLEATCHEGPFVEVLNVLEIVE